MTRQHKQPVDQSVSLESVTKVVLDEAVEQQSNHVVKALVSRREAVLNDAFSQPEKPVAERYALAAVALSVLLVVAFLMLMPAGVEQGQQNSLSLPQDPDVLLMTEQLEFYRDMEFYQWLEVSDSDSSEQG